MFEQQRQSPRSVLAAIFRDSDYRAILVELFLLGVASGLVLPFVALWVTSDLHGTTGQAALIYVPAGIVAVVANIGAGIYSDKVGRRRGVILVALLCGGISRIGLAFATDYRVAIVLYALTGFSPFAIVFALLRDTIISRQSSATGDSGAFITTLERTAFSLGWLVGPVLGGFIIEYTGFGGLFLISGALFLLGLLWAFRTLFDQPAISTRTLTPLRKISAHDALVLGLLFIFGLLLFAGDRGRVMFLTLHLIGNLHFSVVQVSWAYFATVVSELLLMPLSGRLADRFGATRVAIAGVTAQAAFFFSLSIASTVWQILMLQVPYAFVVSTSNGIAIVLAQKSMPAEMSAVSTSTYMVSGGLAPILNSALIGTSVVAGSFPRMFDVLGLLASLSLALVLVLAFLGNRRSISSRS